MFQEFLNGHNLNKILCKPGDFHPYPRIQDRSEWEKLSQPVKDIVVKWGEEALHGYPVLTASQYMGYVRNGNRKDFETPYFARRKLLFGAVLAECVENNGRFIDTIIDGIWTICEESSWVVSAHNNQAPEDLFPFEKSCLPDVTDPYVDLFAAQTASVLAYAVYLVKDKLDEVAMVIAARVRKEINERIFQPFLTHTEFWWMGYGKKVVNNWNPWILSNVIDAALLIEENAERQSKEILRAMVMLDHYLAVIPEDGGCDEGPGYYNVAGLSLLDCLESLYTASNGQIDFYQHPHIAAIGAYPSKSYIAGPYFLNFADCDAKPIIDYERIYTFGLRINNQQVASLGAAMYESASMEERILIRDTPQVNRVLSSLFTDFTQISPNVKRESFIAMPKLQVYSWNNEGLYVAVKGGYNEESHNHNDVGQFVVYADGKPEIIDLGNMVYTAATFGPNRYQLLNTRSGNHNLPIVGTTEQANGYEYAAKDVRADENGIALEIGKAYPAEAGIKTLRRQIRICNDGFILEDLAELENEQAITWVFMLRNKPEIKEAKATFGALKLAFDSDLNCNLEEIPVVDERMKRNFDGSLWRMTLTADTADKHHRKFVITRNI